MEACGYPVVLCLANGVSPLARTQRLDMGFATTRLVPALVDPDHYAMVDRKQPDYLFSEHYDRKLRERRIHRLGRFARLGNMLSQLWRYDRFRALAHGPLLTTAHTLFGFPLNVVLRRSKKP
jgi:hypothetical protein